MCKFHLIFLASLYVDQGLITNKNELIACKEFLLLLEGQVVHLLSPKKHYTADICISSDIPIFATGNSRIIFTGRYNQPDEHETEMMRVRWKVFELFHQTSEEKSAPPCPKFFSKLVLLGEVL